MAYPPTAPQPPEGGSTPGPSFRWLVGTVLTVVTLVFMVVALTSVWWVYSVDVPVLGRTTQTTMEFTLTEVRVESDIGGVSQTIPYDESQDSSDLTAVFDNTNLLALVSVLLLTISLVVGILAGLRVVPGFAAVSMGIVAAIFILATALYFFVGLPPALESSSATYLGDLGFPTPTGFSGTQSATILGSTVAASWGPSIGWMLTLIAFFLALIGASMFTGMRKPAPSADYPTERAIAPQPQIPRPDLPPPPSG
jgi:hypothetical protein